MNRENKKALCVMSGGMDSTLSAYMMKKSGYEIIALHFNYNQRTQTKELECFHKICKDLDVLNKYVLDIDFFKHLYQLTDHYLIKCIMNLRTIEPQSPNIVINL